MAVEHGDKGDRGERGYQGEKGEPCRQDHDLLIRVDTKLDTVIEKLTDVNAKVEKQETRIVALESFHNTILAYAASLSLAISLMGTWVLNHLKVS